METEFVNEYITRLNATLHDAVSRNVMHETRVALLEKALSESQIQVEKLKKQNKKTETPTV
jgi:hypothetical protein